MQHKKHHKTIVLSDIHLGSRWAKASQVLAFLRKNSCNTLILCGDIIDGWSIMRGREKKWKRRHTNFMKYLLTIQENTKIIYIRGNHDDFLDRVLPLTFGNMSIVKDYILESNNKRFYVAHGDEFDNVTSSMKWLAKVGDIGYTILLHINKRYNKIRLANNLPYHPISQIIKQKVKASVSYMDDFGNHITNKAKLLGCDGVICGHIHKAEISTINGIEYMNSGDWVESMSALCEDFDGKWGLELYYPKPYNAGESLNTQPQLSI